MYFRIMILPMYLLCVLCVCLCTCCCCSSVSSPCCTSCVVVTPDSCCWVGEATCSTWPTVWPWSPWICTCGRNSMKRSNEQKPKYKQTWVFLPCHLIGSCYCDFWMLGEKVWLHSLFGMLILAKNGKETYLDLNLLLRCLLHSCSQLWWDLCRGHLHLQNEVHQLEKTQDFYIAKSQFMHFTKFSLKKIQIIKIALITKYPKGCYFR